jgi:hypothetical protein
MHIHSSFPILTKTNDGHNFSLLKSLPPPPIRSSPSTAEKADQISKGVFAVDEDMRMDWIWRFI